MDIKNVGQEQIKANVLNDPFLTNKITGIRVNSFVGRIGGCIYHNGSVEFTNNNTQGKQEFTGKSFDDVVLQIKLFLETLNKEDE